MLGDVTVTHPMTVLCLDIPLGLISRGSCSKNSVTNFQPEGVYVTGSRYIIHFYCLEVEAGFYFAVTW